MVAAMAGACLRGLVVGFDQVSTIGDTPNAQASANAASTMDTIGARHWVPKNQRMPASCWLFSANANRVKKTAALKSQTSNLIGNVETNQAANSKGR